MGFTPILFIAFLVVKRAQFKIYIFATDSTTTFHDYNKYRPAELNYVSRRARLYEADSKFVVY